jgi:hypothetical protein
MLGMAIGCKPCFGWEFHTRITLVAHLDSTFYFIFCKINEAIG